MKKILIVLGVILLVSSASYGQVQVGNLNVEVQGPYIELKGSMFHLNDNTAHTIKISTRNGEPIKSIFMSKWSFETSGIPSSSWNIGSDGSAYYSFYSESPYFPCYIPISLDFAVEIDNCGYSEYVGFVFFYIKGPISGPGPDPGEGDPGQIII